MGWDKKVKVVNPLAKKWKGYLEWFEREGWVTRVREGQHLREGLEEQRRVRKQQSRGRKKRRRKPSNAWEREWRHI